jgi:hypothetical protein
VLQKRGAKILARAEKATEVDVLKQENDLLRAAIAAADAASKGAVDVLQVRRLEGKWAFRTYIK